MTYKLLVRSIIETAAVKVDNARKVDALLTIIINKSNRDIRDLGNDSNPQVVMVKTKIKERIYIAEAVQQALNGNFADLKSYG